jgi:predicted HicB family RNase H-like nuclease
MPKKNSDAKIAANNRYNEKAYDRINIAVPKGKKAVIKAYAEKSGESINSYINKAIEEKIARDNDITE